MEALAATPRPAVAQAKGLSLAEDLRIAANARNDVLLEPIADFELDSEGLVYVLQPKAAVIEVFSPEGRLLRRIARRGSGPGELVQPVHFGIVRDTIWVVDGGTRRMSFFRRDGKFLGTRSAVARTRGGVGSSLAEAALPGGQSVVRVTPLADGGRTSVLRLGTAVLIDSAGSIVDTVAPLPQVPAAIRIRANIGGAPAQLAAAQPFADKLFIAWSNVDGTLVTVSSRAPSRALGATFHLSKRRGRTTVVDRHVGVIAQPVSEEIVSATLARLASPPRPNGMRVEIDRAEVRRQLVAPPFLPPIEEVTVAPDGKVWLAEASTTAAVKSYRVLDAAGTPVTRVDMRGSVVSLRVGRTHAWALERNSDGEEFLVRLVLPPVVRGG
ncbi:MAG: 6-bladed beta-propeller [Gemmatimonadaceae bacterium]